MKLVPLALFALALPVAFTTSCQSGTKDVEVSTLCEDCGVVAGSEGCCDPDAERCADCGKIKGSAGCCK